MTNEQAALIAAAISLPGRANPTEIEARASEFLRWLRHREQLNGLTPPPTVDA